MSGFISGKVFSDNAPIAHRITSNPYMLNSINNRVDDNAMQIPPANGTHIENVFNINDKFGNKYGPPVAVARPGEIIDANNNRTWVDGVDENNNPIIQADSNSPHDIDYNIDEQIEDVHSIQTGPTNISHILLHIISGENTFISGNQGTLKNKENVVMYSNSVPGFGEIKPINSTAFFKKEIEKIQEDIGLINIGVEQQNPIYNILRSLQNIHTIPEEISDMRHELNMTHKFDKEHFKDKNYGTLYNAITNNLHSNIFIPHTDMEFSERRGFNLITVMDIRYPIDINQLNILTNPEQLINNLITNKSNRMMRGSQISTVRLSTLINTLKNSGFAYITIIVSGGGRPDELDDSIIYTNQFHRESYLKSDKSLPLLEKIKDYTRYAKDEFNDFSKTNNYRSFGGKHKRTRKRRPRRRLRHTQKPKRRQKQKTRSRSRKPSIL